MKTKNWEINIGQGLGEITFGMNRVDIRKILGDPEDIEQYEYVEGTGEMAESWHYDEEEISLTFFEENADWQLETIAVGADHYVLEDQKLIGETKEGLLKKLEAMDLGKYEIEGFPDEPGQEVISLVDQNILIWVEDNEVHEIQWEPLWEE